MKKLIYIFLVFLIAVVSFDGYSAKFPKTRFKRGNISYQSKWQRLQKHHLQKQHLQKQHLQQQQNLKQRLQKQHLQQQQNLEQRLQQQRLQQQHLQQQRLQQQQNLKQPILPMSQQNLYFKNEMNHFLEYFNSRYSQLLRDAIIPLKKYQQTYPLVPGYAAKQADFVTRFFNQYFQQGRTYSDLMNELVFKLPLETKEDVVTCLLFHCFLEDWLTNGHLTGCLSRDFLSSTTYLLDFLPKDKDWFIARTYAELVYIIMNDVERKTQTPLAVRHNNIEAMDHFSQQSEDNPNGYPSTTQDESRSRQSKREESKRFSEEIDLAEWIHSAEVYHKLIDLFEALYELGSDSNDDSDENYDKNSDTIAVDSTKPDQVVFFLMPIN